MLDLPVVILVDPLNSEVIEFFFVDDVVLSKAEEKDDGLLFSLLFELALLEENTLVVNFPIFVDVLNSEIKELDVCTRCVVPLVADSIV